MYFLRSFARSKPRSFHCFYAGAKAQSICRLFHNTTPALSASADMETVHTSERLAHLRDLMQKHKVDIYSMLWWVVHSTAADIHAVVPSEDSHQSEYIAPCDARRGPSQARPLLQKHALTFSRIHLRLFRLGRHGGDHPRQSCSRDGRPVLQSSGKTIG